jgi:uncharacterized Zn finger protein
VSAYAWKPYVPAAKRRRKAERAIAGMKKAGKAVAPIVIEGRAIARSFWGKAWCDNLERYSDYANRLPRGRTYVRNGSVLDLHVATGEIAAAVIGSRLYAIRIRIVPVSAARWKAICNDCAGSIDSLVELLQGKLAKGVMNRVCRQGDGLFPTPAEITLSCSCPDWADMCKHVAAVLYGVGARLDEQPELLFLLRGVKGEDLVVGADAHLQARKSPASLHKVLAGADLASVFGLDMAEAADTSRPPPQEPTPSRRRSGAAVPARAKATGQAKGPRARRRSRAEPLPVGRKSVATRSRGRGTSTAHRRTPPTPT